MKTKFKDEKVDELRPGYDLDTLLKKDARGKYAKHFERVWSVEKNGHQCLGRESKTEV